ncbi:MAG: helix-turn-helix transcriptional regulator [Geminicoccaceae bacterium]
MAGLASGLDYAVVTICFLVSIILMSRGGHRRDHIWAFAAFLLCIGLDRVDDILVRADLYNTIPAVMEWALLLKLLQPLAIYHYTRAMTSPSLLRLRSLFPSHLIACLIGVALALPYLTLDGDIKLAEHLEVDHPADDSTRVFMADLFGLTFIFYLTVLRYVYLIRSFRLIANHHRQIQDLFSNVDDKTLSWLRYMIFILGALWLLQPGYIILLLFDIADPPESFFNAVDAIALGTLGCLGLRQGAIYDHACRGEAIKVEQGDDEPTAMRPVLDNDHAVRISVKLNRAMDEQQLYRDPTLTLRQLSDSTQISVHRISEVLNQHMGTNFYDFVNSWRIEEAKLLLQKDKKRSVLDIAMDVGFNSKSTFYSAFNKLVDESPAAFRRQNSEIAGEAGLHHRSCG